MSRYRWPNSRRSEDRPHERMKYNARTSGVLPAGAIPQARDARAGGMPAMMAPSAPPAGEVNLWVPIGPSTVLKGQAGAQPRVAGRVRDVWVSPDGLRAYAGAANGGVWFSSDAGNFWSPLGNWLATPGGSDISNPATTLTCGCLLVSFGAAADGSADDIYVGTGELIPDTSQGTPGAQLGGIGVLHLDKPVPQVLSDPFGQPWKREAKNLTNFGIYRLARHPADATQMVAATSVGLFKRTGSFVENADWTKVTAGPFNFLQTSGKYITDVLWVNTAPKPRLFVALIDASNFYRAHTELWFSDDGPDGPYTQIALPNPNVGRTQRLAFAGAPSDPTVVYVTGSGPRLWRVSGATAIEVKHVPNLIFGDPSADQSRYDMAIAVHPDNKDIVAVGGSTVKADGEWSASLFQFTIVPEGAGLSTGFSEANQSTPANDPAFIGNCVHADVHQVRYIKVGADMHLWVSCDGGVFRSTRASQAYTFVARNAGLAVLEADYVASHPQNDAFVLSGSQDNGLLMRVGDTLWTHSREVGGDAGSVVINPIKNRYFIGQYHSASWRSNGTLMPSPVLRGTGGTSEAEEDKKAGFYSGCDVRQIGTRASLAIGTNRLWLADNWDPEAVLTSWVTLPSATDPRQGTGTDLGKDTYNNGSGKVICCKWVDDNRLMVLMQPDYSGDGTNSVVILYQRNGASWKRDVFSAHSNKKSNFGNSDISQPTSSYLPPLGAWSDLAVHDAGASRAPRGSIYVAATGDGTSDRMDTLWWYNGSDTWYPTGLRNSNAPDNQGTKAPAFAVVVDPSDPTVVLVGTALGVWRGLLSFAGTTPSWKWQPFSNGLPEAAVQDISIYSKGEGDVKILRAAIQARGVWEVDLSKTPAPTKRTFLRVHPNDARRMAVSTLDNPMNQGPATWRWYGSPDIRIRPAPLAAAEPVPAFPAGALSGYPLWIFQTALHALDPLCRPTGIRDAFFDARLKQNDSVKGTLIDQPRWAAVVTRANVFAPPWEGPEPTEADLYELIVEDGTDPESGVIPAPPPLTVWPSPPPVARVARRKHKIDVLVHYRDLRPLGKDQVRVTLLQRALPPTVAQWGTQAIADTWKAAIQVLASGSPFGGALPDGWQVSDGGSLTRQLTSDIDARTPRVVTFDANFSGLTIGQYAVLLAVVHSTPDPVTAASLIGATLQDLVLSCHQVAARVVQCNS
jgi:hypothetical protein